MTRDCRFATQTSPHPETGRLSDWARVRQAMLAAGVDISKASWTKPPSFIQLSSSFHERRSMNFVEERNPAGHVPPEKTTSLEKTSTRGSLDFKRSALTCWILENADSLR